jgi:hypothetical protein
MSPPGRPKGESLRLQAEGTRVNATAAFTASAASTAQEAPAVPTIKNRMFQPLGLMLRDGTMLHLPPRAEREVAAAELGAPPFQAAVANGQLSVRVRALPAVEPARPAPPEPEPSPAPEPLRRRPRKT